MKIGITKTVQKAELMELDGPGLINLISAHVSKEAGARIATVGFKDGGFITYQDNWSTLSVHFDAVLLKVSEFEDLQRKAKAYDEYIEHIHAPQSIKPVMAAMDHLREQTLPDDVKPYGPIIEAMSMMRNPSVPDLVVEEPNKGLNELYDEGYRWLARDKNGFLVAYDLKPFKINDEDWNFDGEHYIYLKDQPEYVTDVITWDDEEPTLIEDCMGWSRATYE